METELFLVLRIAAAVALFSFIGWAIYTLWTEINIHKNKASVDNTPPIKLTSVQESVSKIPEQITFNFSHSPIYIGRDTSCDLYLQESTLSARHACIEYHHKQWWIEDLRSSNGTYINDVPVLSPIVMKSEDHLRCGEVEFIIEIGVNYAIM